MEPCTVSFLASIEIDVCLHGIAALHAAAYMGITPLQGASKNS